MLVDIQLLFEKTLIVFLCFRIDPIIFENRTEWPRLCLEQPSVEMNWNLSDQATPQAD
jgi:hypothetical protein